MVFNGVLMVFNDGYNWVVFLEHDWMIFPDQLGLIIIPIDELIFIRGVGIPPTSLITMFFPV